MSLIQTGGYTMDIDIHAELSAYDWRRARWTSDKLIACSPFRDDSAPSFYVHLTGDAAGTWGDSGGYDDEYRRGGFVRLLAYLRNESEASTVDYLLAEYGALYGARQDEPIRLPEVRLNVAHKGGGRPLTITPAISPYLRTRGISADVQRLYGVGYDADHPGFTAMPWRNTAGIIRNIKYRATTGKAFFYARGGVAVSRLVYGIDTLQGADMAAVCEGEIDALSWATAGIPAVAVGSASISREQADLLRRSSVRRLILAGDNDAAGRRLNEQMARLFAGQFAMETVDYGARKDANEVLTSDGADALRELPREPVQSLRIATTFSIGKS